MTTRATFTARDISSDHYINRVLQNGVSGVDGVQQVTAVFGTKRVDVTYNQAVTSPDVIRAAPAGVGDPGADERPQTPLPCRTSRSHRTATAVRFAMMYAPC
jgi:hypothetical protein